jgi:hypothetical protein
LLRLSIPHLAKGANIIRCPCRVDDVVMPADEEKGTGVINAGANRAGGKKELETTKKKGRESLTQARIAPAARRNSKRSGAQYSMEGRYDAQLWLQQIFTLLGLESSVRPPAVREKSLLSPPSPLSNSENDSRPLCPTSSPLSNFGYNRSSRYWDWNPQSGLLPSAKNHS